MCGRKTVKDGKTTDAQFEVTSAYDEKAKKLRVLSAKTNAPE